MSDIEADLPETDNINLDENYVNEYWSTYRKHIHTLLAWGYIDSKNKVIATHEEPAITGFIAEAIQDRLDAIDSPSWCDQISIKDDPPIRGGGRTGRGRWRPDLIFESTAKRPRPRYHFEAKRLRKQQSVDDYLGKDGLCCFISGRYAGESVEAGMLGYVQSDNLTVWTERIQLAINQDTLGKNMYSLVPPQCSIQIIDSFPLEWLSKHKRNAGNDIFVHHLLLDYCLTNFSYESSLACESPGVAT